MWAPESRGNSGRIRQGDGSPPGCRQAAAGDKSVPCRCQLNPAQQGARGLCHAPVPLPAPEKAPSLAATEASRLLLGYRVARRCTQGHLLCQVGALTTRCWPLPGPPGHGFLTLPGCKKWLLRLARG